MNELDSLVEEDLEPIQQTDKYLLFRLGTEEYGINIARITAIEELQKITVIPDMPDFVKGVINLRGKVIPAIDLRLRFGLEARKYDDRTCIVIVSIQDSTVGLIVDIVSEVHEISHEDIGPTPNFEGSTRNSEYISGLARKDEEVKIILDVQKIFSSNDKTLLKKIENK